jgi:hypothetical protein
MKKTHKNLTADWFGATGALSVEVYLDQPCVADQPIAVICLAGMNETTRNGP